MSYHDYNYDNDNDDDYDNDQIVRGARVSQSRVT